MKLVRISVIAAVTIMVLSLLPGVVMARNQHGHDKQKTEYPNTTREEPKLDLSDQKMFNTLQEGLRAAQTGDETKADELLSPIADGRGRSRSKYAQALAQQGLATMKYNAGDHAAGIKLLQAALDNGVLPNDTYFQLMYTLAQFYLGDHQYEKSLTTLHKWREQGRRETAQSYALEGNLEYRLEKFPEAIAALKKAKSMDSSPQPDWDQLLAAAYAQSGQSGEALTLAQAALAKNPNDVTTMRNVAILMLQSDKLTDAERVYADGINRGILTEGADFDNLARVYLMIGQNKDDPKADVAKALKTVDDGLAKGALKPGLDVYKLQGDAASIGMEPKKALTYYAKAEPYAKDGEIALRQAQMYMNLDQYDAAATSANTAIQKGVKHMGDAYLALGAAEAGRHHKSAAIAAVKKAATYPDSKEQAEAWLKKANR